MGRGLGCGAATAIECGGERLNAGGNICVMPRGGVVMTAQGERRGGDILCYNQKSVLGYGGEAQGEGEELG